MKNLTAAPVILSGAPLEIAPRMVEGRGVEGSLRCFVSPCRIKAFSREFPDTSCIVPASSGSFDSPSSRSTELGLAQDDSGRGYRSQKGSSRAVKLLLHAWQILTAALREIFDESAYDRFLLRTHSTRSVESYREFLREREATAARRPRCC
jgi:hypothetical protein